jgi:hypothetical protein
MDCRALRGRRNQLLITYSAFFSYWRKVGEQCNSMLAICSRREVLFVDVSSVIG